MLSATHMHVVCAHLWVALYSVHIFAYYFYENLRFLFLTQG